MFGCFVSGLLGLSCCGIGFRGLVFWWFCLFGYLWFVLLVVGFCDLLFYSLVFGTFVCVFVFVVLIFMGVSWDLAHGVDLVGCICCLLVLVCWGLN